MEKHPLPYLQFVLGLADGVEQFLSLQVGIGGDVVEEIECTQADGKGGCKKRHEDAPERNARRFHGDKFIAFSQVAQCHDGCQEDG